jgi:aerobic carbon-monoxide dehydrogenase medium subunit
MKAPNLNYVRPKRLADALDLLQQHDGAAIPLAGGQSLLAALNMRLSSREILVDIGDLRELNGISVSGGIVHIGALATHATVLGSPVVRTNLPLLAEAVRHVGHVAIRNRGTIGGSIANADPAAEIPACAVALGASIIVASRSGEREVPAEHFFRGLFETDLANGELITEIRFPVQHPDDRWTFAELSRRHGDFAIAGIVAVARVSDAAIAAARVVYFGCVERAKRADTVSDALVGRALPLDNLDWIADATAADLAPFDSPGWKASTKLHLATILTERSLRRLEH